MEIALCIGAIAVGLAFIAHQWKRSADVKVLASRLELVYLGNALPKSLTVSGTDLAGISSAWNVIDGERHGVRVIAFDCRIGTGKGSWRRTVIAVQTSDDNLRYLAGYLELHRSDKWTLLYAPRSSSPTGLMPVAELAGYIEAI